MFQTSLVTDSPVHSSSSDVFAPFLDENLQSDSSKSSPEEETDDGAYDGNDRIKRLKEEKSENTEEPCASTLHESVEDIIGTEASREDTCTHPGSFGDMCIRCGKRLEVESGVAFGYIHKGLRLSNDEVARLRAISFKKLLHHKKLYLVLDLDHTLLNTTILVLMTSEEEYLKSQTDSLQDVSKGSLFRLDFMHMMTKLRPFVREFLKEASQMFEMYIYTMGDRAYALQMASLLDPRREYFGDRVISRDDGTLKHQKSLDVVLGKESAVLILDDSESVWAKHKDNLILMERYDFFSFRCQRFGHNCKSFSELKSDESEHEGALSSVLKVLRQIHSMFFNNPGHDLADRDVRQLLKAVRKEVLKGCKIVFSRVISTKVQAETHHLWKIAEQLGATCSIEVDPSVTHVVSTDSGTDKSRWAVKENKFLVQPRWLEATNFFFKNQDEENFPVTPANNK